MTTVEDVQARLASPISALPQLLTAGTSRYMRSLVEPSYDGPSIRLVNGFQLQDSKRENSQRMSAMLKNFAHTIEIAWLEAADSCNKDIVLKSIYPVFEFGKSANPDKEVTWIFAEVSLGLRERELEAGQ